MIRRLLLYTLSLFYFTAGINHFLKPAWYIHIIPPALPFRMAINYISGACEIILSILVLFPATRKYGAWGLVILLVLIFPANIYMSVDYYRQNHPWFWFTIARLPLQGVLIWWAWEYTKPVVNEQVRRTMNE